MENHKISHQNLINFPVKSHTLPLAAANGISHCDADDIEMIAFENLGYTSLKDLMPSSSPPAAASPTGGSWREIPIKDPLVQHAAWAYLQPMAGAPDDGDRWWKRLERRCCGLLGCFNGVVSAICGGWFAGDDKVD